MGNLGGGEVLVILLVALVVLGPTKLPTALRQFGRFVGEVRRIGAGFQQELRDATEPLSEPLRETKATLRAADQDLRTATQAVNKPHATHKPEPAKEVEPDQRAKYKALEELETTGESQKADVVTGTAAIGEAVANQNADLMEEVEPRENLETSRVAESVEEVEAATEETSAAPDPAAAEGADTTNPAASGTS